ncbi:MULTISPECIES: class I poly(R)-hydroxyalkanoic acid synthase [unclassified Rhizobacter]|uniref:class I poly(R)-hydroxyalkanoic acid synthase n=1 Tax=unclassified Rhizobacter TaxID=2640088 RepID=UPI0009EAF9AF|nr:MULTISPECIES: class I poly(R)-hydroxyalkanoic acid synthase [unclassified Rhizobacter]
MSGLSVPLPQLSALQADYMAQASALWNQSVAAAPSNGAAHQPEPLGDRRFSSPAWADNPMASFTARMYLLNARTLTALADSVQGDEKTRERIRFAVQQYVAAASPSNYLPLNPEALQLALKTQGESILHGVQHLVQDLQQGHVSQTDESVFEVGRNVATTEGSVVFENELFQLLEYKPLTKTVFERPLLMVPPCINKYYILDLQPENSLIRHAVAQGHRVFVVSWRNADASLSHLGWDDYIEDAAIRAIEVVQEITGAGKENGSLNTLGFCVGGTILATALAVLAARGSKPAASITLLTTFLDFSNTGVLDLFVDEAMVQLREMTLGPASPNGGGLLKGQELASTFSALRPNDLLWNYVVGNYLKGETPPPFDLLYWNSDSTNLPGPMYCWYLRNTYLENNLVKPGRLTVCGEKLDLNRVDAPTYVYGSREDHIVPWDAAWRNTQVLKKAKTRFVLGASGHIAGVINPPAKKKRSHWIGPAQASQPASAEAWLATAKEHPGSWWTDWDAWLAGHAGRQVPAPKNPGSRRHKPIEPAPGRYVKQKA